MDQGGFEHLDAEALAVIHGLALVIEPPKGEIGTDLLHLIPLDGLGRQVEDPAIRQGATQLDIFGMGPDQGHGGAGGLAEAEFLLGDVGGIPDLFRQEAAFVGEPGQGRAQHLGGFPPTRGEFEVGPLPGEQGPGPADAGAVEGGPVFMLPVAIAVVAPPQRPRRSIALEQRVNYLDGIHDARITRGPESEADQGQGIRADEMVHGLAVLSWWAVLHGHEPGDRGGGVRGIRWGNAHVVAVHTHFPGQFRVRHISPALDGSIPGIGRLPEIPGQPRFPGIGEVRRAKERGHFHGQGEG